jgi:hypothetical protein
MTRVEVLREQARVLSALAESFDNARIRKQLSEFAEQCAEWAAERERALSERRAPLPDA